MKGKIALNIPEMILGTIVLVLCVTIIQTVFAATVSNNVVVGNATPAVSAVTLNHGNPITLVASTTVSVDVNATVSDANGCSDVFTNGTTTVLVYRSLITSSTCLASPNNLNCYKTSLSLNTCSGTSTSATATGTIAMYYLAQATDASSSFSGQSWIATVIAQDGSAATSTADSPGIQLNTLNAFNVSTSSIAYSTVPAGTDTAGVNKIVGIINVGNSSTTLKLSGTSLVSGVNAIATTSQHYASSSFTYNTGDVALTDVQTTVGGFVITGPTSTASMDSKNTYWGIGIPSGTATGTYNGTSTFTAVYSP